MGLLLAPGNVVPAEDDHWDWPTHIQTVLEGTSPLEHDRGDRLPLYLWQAKDPGPISEQQAEFLLKELDSRGVGLVCTWRNKNRQEAKERALRIAAVQDKLGLRVNIDATSCLYSFYTDTNDTAHLDDQDNPFWDESSGKKLGCPFRLEHRIPVIRERIEYFAQAYLEAGVSIDFVFADWEVDGPFEFNLAHDAAMRCKVCRRNITNIENFAAFQKVIRKQRSRLQRQAFVEPIISRFPDALVMNYGVYPHDGYRYWYDYFEKYVEGQPALTDQKGKYRLWFHEFPLTGYTAAMPVVYTWYPIFSWYDFESTDYRWFYNMLLVASNAGKHTPQDIPVVCFVHWHTTAPPKDADPAVKQFSEQMYQELLWHMLLRGVDTFFLWCQSAEAAKEIPMLHAVYADAQQYGRFIEEGTPITYEVPKQPATVVSGLLLDDQVLVRRTDFGDSQEMVELKVGSRTLVIPPKQGQCSTLSLK
jgi:hypothetical protein